MHIHPTAQTDPPFFPCKVSSRALVWNFAGAVVLRLLVVVLASAAVSAALSGWMGTGGVSGTGGALMQVPRTICTKVKNDGNQLERRRGVLFLLERGVEEEEGEVTLKPRLEGEAGRGDLRLDQGRIKVGKRKRCCCWCF